MKRQLALIAVGLAGLASVPAIAGAQGPVVVVNGAGTSQSTAEVPLAELAPDVGKAAGGPGYSMRSVLSEAAAKSGEPGWLDPEETSSFEVEERGGDVATEIPLDQALSVKSPRPFFVVDGDGGVTLLLPGGQRYDYPNGRVTLKARAKLSVTLSASPAKPKPGEEVLFIVDVSGAGSATYTYTWTFSDGDGPRTTSSPAFRHTFRGAGRRWARVVVEGGGDRGEDRWEVDAEKDRRPEENPSEGGGRPKPGPDSPTESGATTGSAGGYAGGNGTQPGATPGTPQGSPSASQPPKDDPVTAESPDGLERVSGVIIDPAASASAAAPETGLPEEADPLGSSAFGLSGEAATLLGVGLLIALGSLIEKRVLVRRP